MDSSSSADVINNHDPSSVYYIHLSDVSSTQLVSVKFDGNGFNNWKRSMLLVLSAKNKVGFVDRTIAMPDRDSIEYKFWSRCNDLVISWIIFNLDATIAKSVLFLQTAKEIWSDFEERYGYASMTEVYSLEQRLSEIVQDANPLPQCTYKLCTCNLTQRIHDRQQDQKLLQFMMKLNDSFVVVRANVLMMHPLPNVSATYRLFAQEERHKEISHLGNQTEAMAFMANARRFNNSGGSRNFRNTQFNGQGGVYNARADNSVGNKRPKERVAAIAQGSSELHFTEEQKSEILGSHSGNISVEQYSQLMDLLNKQTVGENFACADDQNAESGNHTALLTGKTYLLSCSRSNWLLDSGATDHITNCLEDFSTYRVISGSDSTITIPDGSVVTVTHIGNVLIHDNILLKDVLLDHSLKGPPTLLGKLQNGLYSVDVTGLNKQSPPIQACLSSSSVSDSTSLWHIRLGHLPFSQIKLVLPFTDVKNFTSEHLCQNQFHTNIMCVRSDNALELTAGNIKQLYLREGIINQTTCAYTPQQNGVVERKHRHLLETARCLYVQSQVPDKY
ncbi:uncharacterized protein LOC141691950 [Apium graveolens]|uniref:uncharacterized protein LOC141691950 n=1 Tax=Apium graveolens TaxID=4045 RepID=UPI003D799BF4